MRLAGELGRWGPRLAVLLAFGVLLWSWLESGRNSHAAAPPGVRPPDAAAGAVVSAEMQLAPAVARFDQEFEQALSQVRKSLAPERPAPVPVALAAEAPDPWPDNYPRTQFELAAHFARYGGQLKAAQLVRHVRLNRHDKPIAKHRVVELESLLESYNRIAGPLVKQWRNAQTLEVIREIERGRLLPERRQLSEQQIEQLAKLEVECEGGDLEQIKARLRVDPDATGITFESGLWHAKRFYPARTWPELPRSEAMLEAISFLSFEFLAVVVDWFERQAVLNPTDAMRVLSDATSFRAARRR